MNCPVLFLIFNRPDTTRKVFAEIRRAKPARLYIAADGPRKERTTDIALCEQTRDIINEIDWPCQSYTLYRKENLGCKLAVSSAINWFFEREESGIILEDDCLPHPTFFKFCEIMLERYKDDTRVMHIGGSNFQEGMIRGDGDYYYSKWTPVWGWASWRRAWKNYDVNMVKWIEFKKNNYVGK